MWCVVYCLKAHPSIGCFNAVIQALGDIRYGIIFISVLYPRRGKAIDGIQDIYIACLICYATESDARTT